MVIDFSLLKNIDFTNTDNLIFLSIVLLIFIILAVILILILVKGGKAIKIAISKGFDIGPKKPESTQILPADQEKVLRKDQISPEVSSSPRTRVMGGYYSRDFNPGEKVSEEKTALEASDEKSQKNIAEGLSKLKSGDAAGRGGLESKMPSRAEADSEKAAQEKIKIPTPKRYPDNSVAPENNSGQIRSTVQGVAGSGKTIVMDSRGTIRSSASAEEKRGVAGTGDSGGALQKIVGAQGSPKNTDAPIFGGGSEISKIKLEHEMKADPKIWQASRQVGLNLNRVERAELVKEVFTPAQGRNISKTDLKQSIRKLNRKMLGTTDSAEHAKIRKEIKFFKKIGGIK